MAVTDAGQTLSTGKAGASVRPTEGPWQIAFRRFKRHRAGVIAAIVLMAIVALVIVGPMGLIPRDAAFRPNPLNINQPPTWEHWFGTDEVGRDIFARIVYGGRVSLLVGMLAMVVSITLGVFFGAVAGYYGGLTDSIIMRLVDVMLSVPGIFLIIAFSVFLGPSLRTIVLAIGFLNWMGVARIVRASFLSLKSQDFVLASHMVGVPNHSIMAKHILPNAMAPIVVAATLTVGAAILTETAVSYLGLGIQPPTPSWGNMLKNAQDLMWSAPWVALFPGMMIFITTLCINFVGDAMRDALDPRMKL